MYDGPAVRPLIARADSEDDGRSEVGRLAWVATNLSVVTGRCHLSGSARRSRGSAGAQNRNISREYYPSSRVRFFIVGIARRDYARANPDDLSRGCITGEWITVRRITIEDGSYETGAAPTKNRRQLKRFATLCFFCERAAD